MKVKLGTDYYVEIDPWCGWIAMDKDGDWYAFEQEPEIYIYGGMWTNQTGSECDYIGCTVVNNNWKKQLYKITQ